MNLNDRFSYCEPNDDGGAYEYPVGKYDFIYWFFWGLWCGLTQRAVDLRHALFGGDNSEEDIPFSGANH